jgi:hypothetical protein
MKIIFGERTVRLYFFAVILNMAQDLFDHFENDLFFCTIQKLQSEKFKQNKIYDKEKQL